MATRDYVCNCILLYYILSSSLAHCHVRRVSRDSVQGILGESPQRTACRAVCVRIVEIDVCAPECISARRTVRNCWRDCCGTSKCTRWEECRCPRSNRYLQCVSFLDLSLRVKAHIRKSCGRGDVWDDRVAGCKPSPNQRSTEPCLG